MASMLAAGCGGRPTCGVAGDSTQLGRGQRPAPRPRRGFAWRLCPVACHQAGRSHRAVRWHTGWAAGAGAGLSRDDRRAPRAWALMPTRCAHPASIAAGTAWLPAKRAGHALWALTWSAGWTGHENGGGVRLVAHAAACWMSPVEFGSPESERQADGAGSQGAKRKHKDSSQLQDTCPPRPPRHPEGASLPAYHQLVVRPAACQPPRLRSARPRPPRTQQPAAPHRPSCLV